MVVVAVFPYPAGNFFYDDNVYSLFPLGDQTGFIQTYNIDLVST